jgi:hypothetical protein
MSKPDWKYGVIRAVAGGYNSDRHIDDDGTCPEEGDPWYEYTPRGEAGPELAKANDHIEKLETLIKDFFILLDKTEETDEGRVFRPNRISSCRAQDGQKLENLLRLMKATVEGRW